MIIGITGGSGSGKTAFIRALREKFEPSKLAIVSEDNYYRPRQEQIKDDQGVINFDVPEAIDAHRLVEDIHRLQSGQSIRKTEYLFNNELANPKEIEITPASTIIIEGLFIMHRPEIRCMLDLSILIHARDELKIIRRIKRDQLERNYPLDDVLYRYQHHVSPSYQKYIMPYLEDIDLTINNNKHFQIGVALMTSFIQDQ